MMMQDKNCEPELFMVFWQRFFRTSGFYFSFYNFPILMKNSGNDNLTFIQCHNISSYWKMYAFRLWLMIWELFCNCIFFDLKLTRKWFVTHYKQWKLVIPQLILNKDLYSMAQWQPNSQLINYETKISSPQIQNSQKNFANSIKNPMFLIIIRFWLCLPIFHDPFEDFLRKQNKNEKHQKISTKKKITKITNAQINVSIEFSHTFPTNSIKLINESINKYLYKINLLPDNLTWQMWFWYI